MAIDTKAKRASVQAYLLGAMRPPPDGTVSSGDRATVSWLYSGLSYITPVSPNYINIVQGIARRILQKISFQVVETRRDVE